MIDLQILHKSNQDGDNLLDLISDNFEQVDSEIIHIDNVPFLNITINNGSKFSRIINPPQSQLNCLNQENMFKILSRHNIACKKNSRELISRYYEILVFDIAVISIKQRIATRAAKTISYIKPNQCEKAAELSKKAVYHLGLDYAMVKIALTASKQHLVVDIKPSPHIRPMDLQKLMVKINKIYHEDEITTGREVKLGADPEFMLSKNRRMIPASIYFPRHGRVGCDNIRTRDRQQHPIGELRPQPSVSPLKLTKNLKAALHSAVRLAPSRKLKWIAGSGPFKGYPIGGHIHFSNIKLNFAVLRSLDNFLAIPILMLENSKTAAWRRKKYGALADYRVKKYGGFEYRTLSSWLVSPEITRAVLCLAKIIVSQYLELTHNYLNTLEAQKAFYKGDKEYFKPVFNDLWSILCQTNMYSLYADELQVIQDMINNGASWHEKDDLRKTWDLPEHSKKKPKADYKKSKTRNRKYHNTLTRTGNNTVVSRRRHVTPFGRNQNASLNSNRARSLRRSRNAVRSSANSNIRTAHRFEAQRGGYRSVFTHLG